MFVGWFCPFIFLQCVCVCVCVCVDLTMPNSNNENNMNYLHTPAAILNNDNNVTAEVQRGPRFHRQNDTGDDMPNEF